MEDKPRYSKLSDAIALIILMQSKFNGISLSDIQNELNVSRRTAERIRDSLLNAMPQIEELDSNDRSKRWGFRNYSLPHLVSFTPSEVATLENLKQNCNKVADEDLKNIITKIKALNNKKLATLENEIEFILRSEGVAVTQKPNYKIDLDSISIIRQAIKNKVKILGEYNGKQRLLSPLGLVYGEKIYLIAREENKGMDEYNYLLHKLSNLRLSTETFDPKSFNLQDFSKKSFGVYHNEIMNVELLFSKEIANEVLNFHFHPTQKIKENEDKSITVKFKASGAVEILWHLFKWGDKVKIISPISLKKQYIELLENVLKTQNL